MHNHIFISSLLLSFVPTAHAAESRVAIRINGSSLSNSETADAFKVLIVTEGESTREIPISKKVRIEANRKKAIYSYTIDQADIDGDDKKDSLSFTITAESIGGKIDLGSAKAASLGVVGGESKRIGKGEGLKISLADVKLTLTKEKQATIESKGFHNAKIVGKSDSTCSISRDNDGAPATLDGENLVYSFNASNVFELKHQSGAFRLKRLSYIFLIKY